MTHNSQKHFNFKKSVDSSLHKETLRLASLVHWSHFAGWEILHQTRVRQDTRRTDQKWKIEMGHVAIESKLNCDDMFNANGMSLFRVPSFFMNARSSCWRRRLEIWATSSASLGVGNKQQTWRHQDVKSCWNGLLLLSLFSRGEYVEAEIMDPMSRFCQVVIRLWTVTSTCWFFSLLETKKQWLSDSTFSLLWVLWTLVCFPDLPCAYHQTRNLMIFGDDSNMGPKKAFLSHFFWREVPC